MRYGILGPVEVTRAGVSVELPGGKAKALLAALLLRAGETVPVQRLVDDLWGENVPETAVKMVQIYISQLRKALGRDAIVTTGTAYRTRRHRHDRDRPRRRAHPGSRHRRTPLHV